MKYNSIEAAKKGYAEASARGDAAGMQEANDAANAIRRQRGEAEQHATGDIQRVKNQQQKNSGSALNQVMQAGSSNSQGGYTGGAELQQYGNSGSTPATSAGSSGPYVPQGGTVDYDKIYLSPEDYTLIQDYKNLFATGTPEQKKYAQEAAAALRKKNGYTTMQDGSGYIALDPVKNMEIAGYDEYLKNSGYGAALDSVRAANDAYLKQLDILQDQQQAGINQGYDDAQQQAWIQHMQSKRTLPQRMSAAGMTGGLADSQEIALDAALQNDHAMLDTKRLGALEQLQATMAQNRLAANQGMMGELGRIQQNASAGYQNFYDNEADRILNDYYTEQARKDAAAQREWEQAYALLQSYGYADGEIAKILGVSPQIPTSDQYFRELQAMGY